MALRFNNLSILVAEDNKAMLSLIRAVLNTLEFQDIHTAADGEDAWRIFQSQKPDIVLTDWEMENMTGIELIRKIRRDPASPNRMIPVVILTGYALPERILEARDAGVTEFLVKPFMAKELANRLAHVINKPRDFIETDTFIGPDRRRRETPGYTPERRQKRDIKKLDPDKDVWHVGEEEK
ncbi:MAG: response regulator [Alphaproteobacteria bacterium]|nr:MAG: response regulator [Alphaproteobacteria bacterium]